MEIGLQGARRAVVVPISREVTTVRGMDHLRRKDMNGGAGTSLENYRMMLSGRRGGLNVMNNYVLSPQQLYHRCDRHLARLLHSTLSFREMTCQLSMQNTHSIFPLAQDPSRKYRHDGPSALRSRGPSPQPSPNLLQPNRAPAPPRRPRA